MRHVLTIAAAAALVGGEATPAPTPAPAPTQTPAATAPIPWLGVGLEEVDDAVAYHLGLTNDLGVMLSDVVEGGPAATLGARRFDVVVGLDGTAVYTPRAIQQAVAAKKPGDPIALSVRRGAQTVELKGAIGTRPVEPPGSALRGRALEPEQMRRFMEDMRQRRGGADGRRGGRHQNPDGSTLEWSVEEGKPEF